MKARKQIIALAVVSAAGILSTQAQQQLFITEVDANGSGNAGYSADWFELFNAGPTTLDLTGWKMDDSSAAFATAVALRGNLSLASGQTMVFLEDGTTPGNDATVGANFEATWGLPSTMTLSYYGGSGVGLSATSGDGVNIFDAGGTLRASVSFGVASSGTFDNLAGLNNAALTQTSVAGVNGAFNSVSGGEIGSPGLVPEPSSLALFATGATLLGMIYRRRK